MRTITRFSAWGNRHVRFAALLAVAIAAFTAQHAAEASTGNNFTMLDGTGSNVGGTNDVVFTWDGTFNTSVATAVENATLSSQTPFFGNNWTAHDVMIYGPGSYTIFTDCPAGEPDCGTGVPYNVTVPPGQVMAHMLFDWGPSTNIDVIEVWDADTFGPSSIDVGGGSTTDPWSAEPNTVWTFMSTDWDGDGINGASMVDGPFVGFNANFNLATATGIEGGGTPNPGGNRTPGPVTIDDPAFGGGGAGGWWTLAGLLAMLGVQRRRLSR